MKKIFLFSVVFYIILNCIFTTKSYTFFEYTWSTLNLVKNVSNNLNDEESIDDTTNPLNLDCSSCILIEKKTGQVLYSYNSHEKLRPASVTKIMSIYLIMEAIENGKINYNTKIPCSTNAESMGGSQIWLSSNEELTVHEMLKAICIVSANDCVTAVAEYLGGTETNFVNMMNAKAIELRYE